MNVTLSNNEQSMISFHFFKVMNEAHFLIFYCDGKMTTKTMIFGNKSMKCRHTKTELAAKGLLFVSIKFLNYS